MQALIPCKELITNTLQQLKLLESEIFIYLTNTDDYILICFFAAQYLFFKIESFLSYDANHTSCYAYHNQDKGAEGKGMIARIQRRLLVVEVRKRIIQFQNCVDQGLVKCIYNLFVLLFISPSTLIV